MQTRHILPVLMLFAGVAIHSEQPAAAPHASDQEAASDFRPVSPELRQTLLAAREAVWRAFYQKDASVIERELPPELITVDEWQDKWRTRDDALADYKKIAELGVKLTRLEFPRTEIQAYGNVAILYSQFVYETEWNGNRSTSSGRSTEMFVLRGGKWVNVGWHLDSGTHIVPREGLRKTLLETREALWRAYLSRDVGALRQALGPEMVATGERQDGWKTFDEFLAEAGDPASIPGRLVRLKFPHTEIRIYGETAILYSSYLYETEVSGKRSETTSGRTTEVFTLREGKWVNVGRHLDPGVRSKPAN